MQKGETQWTTNGPMEGGDGKKKGHCWIDCIPRLDDVDRSVNQPKDASASLSFFLSNNKKELEAMQRQRWRIRFACCLLTVICNQERKYANGRWRQFSSHLSFFLLRDVMMRQWCVCVATTWSKCCLLTCHLELLLLLYTLGTRLPREFAHHHHKQSFFSCLE